MAYWRIERDKDNLVWLYLNHPEHRVNTLNNEVFIELDEQLTRLEKNPPNALILCSDKPSGFIAGADIDSFSPPQAHIQSLIQQAHRVLQHLDDFPATTIALIERLCLGGGLELALACDYRLMDDSPDSQLGFPEIKLGLFPGFGGTHRAISRMGFIHALEFMLTARQVNGKRAKQLGLVTLSLPARQLRNAARHCAKHLPESTVPSVFQRCLGHAMMRPLVGYFLKRKVAEKMNPIHYPAANILINHCVKHASSQVAMEASESQQVSQLLVGETAQNLIRVFSLQQRLKSLAPKQYPKERHVHVIGSGIMGGDIAAWCALKGLTVSLQDQSPDLLAMAYQRAHTLFRHQLKQPHLITAALDRLIPDHRGLAINRADVVIEAIFEDLRAKQQLFAEIEPKLKPSAILATNTSSIPLESLSQSLKDPSRLIGLHFFNPVARMQLIEVVRGKQSAEHWIERGLAFSRQIKRLGLPVNSCPGFLVNRILIPYLFEAINLLDQGVSKQILDQAAEDFGMPMGPIALADNIGLDICLSVAEKLAEPLNLTIPNSLTHRVVEGHLGRKSRQGFYHYDAKGHRLNRPKKRIVLPAGYPDQLILPLLNEAVSCLREGIVSDADLLDAGVIFGTGFAPFLGGPIHSIQQSKKTLLRQRLIHLEKRTQHHFHADSGWKIMEV